VGRGIDRNVTKQVHAACGRVILERAVLSAEEVLSRLGVGDRLGEPGARRRERGWMSLPQVLWPLPPRTAALLGLDGREQRKVGKPLRLARDEGRERLGCVAASRAEPAPGKPDERVLHAAGKLLAAKESRVRERSEIHEPGIAGVARAPEVRRAAGGDGPKWQQLPHGESP